MAEVHLSDGGLLLRFFQAEAQRPFSFAVQHDCLMWLADWVEARRGFDPAAQWRGRYRTPLGAARIIKRRGGVIAHLDACLRPFGVDRTETPCRGDIAVVEAPEGHTGAIVIGSMVARLGKSGIRFGTLPILAAWKV